MKSDTQSQLDRVYGEFCDAWVKGRNPDPNDYCLRHPDIAKELRQRTDAFLFVAEGVKDMAEPNTEKQKNDSPVPIPPDKIVGDFQIIREIGRGGMGVVFEAKQLSLGRTVALKVLPPHASLKPEIISRFKREAATAAKLKHPGIVEIHAVGEVSGLHFFAMELVHGSSLDSIISNLRDKKQESSFWNRPYVETVCKIVVQVAEALDYAHGQGVIHRDIKPSNIIVRDDGQAVLTDFGIARQQQLPSITKTGDFAGTPFYISPQQAVDSRLSSDHRTDVYSLGVTLFELLTLKRPFEGKTTHEVIGKIVSREPPLPRQLNPSVPKDLEIICLTAMEKDLKRRYQTARDFAEDVDRFLDFKPIKARPAGIVTRTSRLVRRNPARALVVCLFALILIGGPLGYAVQLNAANKAMQVVLDQKDEALATARQERERANAEREKAQIEAETARLTTNFLLNLFRSPLGRFKKEQTAALDAILDRGSASVRSKLEDRPLVQAEIMHTLGIVFTSLGRYGKAEQILVDAIAIRTEHLGESNRDRLDSMNEIARLYRRKEAFNKMERLSTEVVRLGSASLEWDDPVLIKALNNLGVLAFDRGRFDDAEKTLNDALSAGRSRFGENHPLTLEIIHGLGNVFLRRGKLEPAEKYIQQSLEGRQSLLGSKDPATMGSLDSLGRLKYAKGQYESALQIFEETSLFAIEVHGPNHDDTLVARSNLAAALQELGQLADAERINREVMESLTNKHGMDHVGRLITQGNLGIILRDQKKYKEAETLLRDSLDRLTNIFGLKHPLICQAMNNLAGLYLNQERFAEAEPLFRQALEVSVEVFGENDDQTSYIRWGLGRLCSMTDRDTDAEELLCIALDGLRNSLGDLHPETLRCLHSVCEHYYRTEKFDSVVPLCREALNTARKNLPRNRCEFLRLLNNLAFCLYKIGDFEEAEDMAIECVDKTPKNDPDLHDRKVLLEEIRRARNNKPEIGG